MKKYIFICLLLTTFSNALYAQINEEKVNKAAALMKKMIENPDQMMTLYQEMQALKLTAAEEKEATKRAQQGAIEQANQIKKEVTATSGVTEQQVKKRMDESKRIIPIRDDKRINAVPKRILTDTELKIFCKAVHEQISKHMYPQAVSQAEELFKQIKNKSANTEELGSNALLVYLLNLTQQSLYMMGRVCSETNATANTLNNYAALLNSFGLQEAAVPILNSLRKKYGASPPVMSNLAMAWFGLGDLKKAGKYADTVIRRFPGRKAHAHYVKAIEKEAEGDRTGAIEEIKQSIDEAYSAEKEDLLHKWGGQMKSNDYKKSLPQDPMGLNRFNFPVLPRSYNAAVETIAEWEKFYNNIETAIEKTQLEFEKKREEYNRKQTTVVQQQAIQTFGGSKFYTSFSNNTNQAMKNYFDVLMEDYARQERSYQYEFDLVEERLKAMEVELEGKMKAVKKRFENTCGEGQPCPELEICNAEKNIKSAYMDAANGLLEAFYTSAIEFHRRFSNNLVYAARYSMEDALYFEVYKLETQLLFLGNLKTVHYKWPRGLFSISQREICVHVAPKPAGTDSLPDYDEVNCKDNWSMTFPGGHKLATRCNKIEVEVDFQVATLGAKEDLVTGEWSNFTIELGYDVGTGAYTGEVLDATAGVSAYIEFDKRGVQDWGTKGKSGVKVGGVKTIEGEKKISMMSGKPDMSSNGEFKSDFGILVLPFK
jgi:tetratricopeptide (TPR) repeat protein